MDILKNKNAFFCSLETIGLMDKYPKDTNTLLELSYIFIPENDDLQVSSSINKPLAKIDLEAMAVHDITEEIASKGVVFNRSKTYKDLYKHANNNQNNDYLIISDSNFTLPVLQNAGINPSGFKIIDIKQVLSHLFLSDYKFIINEPISSLKLNFIRYYLPINENIITFINKEFKKNAVVTNSILKSVILFNVFEYIVKEYSLDLDELVRLSVETVNQKYVFFKNKIQKINELTEHDLIYLYKHHSDKNISITCKNILKEKGIELDKQLITSGKYAGYYVENIDDIEYLEWFEKNMQHLDAELLKTIKNKIVHLKADKTVEKEYMVSIIEEENQVLVIGELPANIRDWLATQPFIEVQYNKCSFIINPSNRKRQETILEKLKKSVKIIKIEKFNQGS